MLHLGYLNYTQYQVMVSFKGLENITYEIKVKFVVSDKLAFVFLLSSRVSRSRFTLSFPPQWKTYNPTFSQVEIWFRFVFVVLTFMVTVRAQITFQILISMNFTWPVFQSDQNGLTFFFLCVSQCLFAHSLRKFSMRDWGIEQKWMSILLPLLLLYNGELQYCLSSS